MIITYLVVIMASSEIERRELILHEHIKNPTLGIRQLGKKLGIAKSTVSDVLNRFSERLSLDRKLKISSNKGAQDRQLASKVVTHYKRNPKISSRDIAKKLKVSQSYVQKVKKRAGLKSFKAQITPDRNTNQNITAKSRSRKLYDNLLTKFDCLVMDDETYCKANFAQIPEQ